MSVVLRYFQEAGANAIRNSFRAGRRAPLAVGPTGMGKTTLFSYIAQQAAAKGNHVMIVAHRQELLEQISETLDRFHVKHGLISPKYTPNPMELVQVASVQALASRMKKRRYRCDLLIIDEAHHVLTTNTWGRVYEGLGQPLTLGVTASPVRSDGRGLGVEAGGVFDDLINIISVGELIDEGYLSPFKVYAPPTNIDLSGVKKRYGDYEKAELAARMDKPTVTGDAVEHFRRICPDAPAVVFGVSIDHCHHIARQFQEAGFSFHVVDGSMDDSTRKRLIRGLGKTHQGIVSCDLVGEGLDVPGIAAAILLRPTCSTGLHIQQVGRALRPVYADGYDLSTAEGRRAAIAASNKPFAIILDHVGNTLVHGLPDVEREWSLEGERKKTRKKKDQEPELAVKQCEQCYAVHMPAPVCPNCGYRYPAQVRQVEQVDGELKEITPEMAAALRRQRRREEAMCESLEDFQKLAEQRGYKPSWARIRWELRQKKRRPAAVEELAW